MKIAVDYVVWVFGLAPAWIRIPFCIWLVVSVVLLVVSFSVFAASRSPGPVGSILEPVAGAEIVNPFNVSGTAEGLRDGEHLWLAVRVNQHLWPKVPELKVSGTRWESQIREDGRPLGRSFTIVVLLADRAAQETILGWHQRGDETGDFPGLQVDALGGARILDSVTVSRSGTP